MYFAELICACEHWKARLPEKDKETVISVFGAFFDHFRFAGVLVDLAALNQRQGIQADSDLEEEVSIEVSIGMVCTVWGEMRSAMKRYTYNYIYIYMIFRCQSERDPNTSL